MDAEPEPKKGPGLPPPNQGPPLGRPPNPGGMGPGPGNGQFDDMKGPDKMGGLSE